MIQYQGVVKLYIKLWIIIDILMDSSLNSDRFVKLYDIDSHGYYLFIRTIERRT